MCIRDSYKTASNLAFIGSIKDDILDIEEIAVGLLEEMQAIDPQKLAARYRCLLSTSSSV